MKRAKPYNIVTLYFVVLLLIIFTGGCGGAGGSGGGSGDASSDSSGRLTMTLPFPDRTAPVTIVVAGARKEAVASIKLKEIPPGVEYYVIVITEKGSDEPVLQAASEL